MTNTSPMPDHDAPLETADANPQAVLVVPSTIAEAGGENTDRISEQEQTDQRVERAADQAVSRRSYSEIYRELQHEIRLRKAAEAETAAAKQKAEEITAAKSFDLARLSHEIRSPMTSILGFGELLLDTPLNDNQSLKVRNLKAAATSLLSIIDDTLDVWALEAGQLQLASAAANLHEIVEDVRLTAAQEAAAKGLYLRCEIDAEVPGWVQVDAQRLSRILLTLVTNGLNFTTHGGVLISVSRGPAAAHGTVRFEIIDTGIGIPPDQQEALFGPTSRRRHAFDRPPEDTSRLGLAVCKQLITVMGGSIGFGSPAENGSRFWIELPLVKATKPIAASPGEISSSRKRNGNILVAEDLLMNQMIIREILEAEGHRVAIARDGIAVIDALHNESFDLILMDLAMPIMGGLETARAIRTLDAARNVPILALTAHVMPMQMAACRAAGMDGYLSKPIDRAALLETVRRWLDPDKVPAVCSLHVMVVDDDPMIRDIAASVLRAAGHQVDCVESGAQAVSATATVDFDVIMMDVRMPDMDGLETTRRIRSLKGAGTYVPIVALTAHTFTKQLTECRNAGMDDYVLKPFDKDTLLAAVLRATGAQYSEPEPWRRIDEAVTAGCNSLVA